MITYEHLTKLYEAWKKGETTASEVEEQFHAYIWNRSVIASIEENHIRSMEKELRDTKRYILKSIKMLEKITSCLSS